MYYLVRLVLLPALLVVVNSEYPVEFEEPFTRNTENLTSYRLPEDLDPIHYDVEITPYFEATDIKEAFTFDGLVSITIEAKAENVSVLTIQENVREILSVTLTNATGFPMRLNPLKPFERVREFHFLNINLAEGLTLEFQQIYRLTIAYIGNINETPLSRGIFRGSYKGTDGRIHWYAASHLQPVNSRQAFPSFDEPGFKSTFSIIINRPINFTQSYSNMWIAHTEIKGDRVREIFFPTPRMSAYLVTIHISEEFSVIADNNSTTRSYRILARPSTEGQGDYALQVGPPITEWLEDYFDIEYYTMADNMKNDQIAVPDWASGATENWGLVSYRELRLLYEEGETNEADKMSIGTITAHELAHKWFGNLITCKWWNNVWVNEGFASYFEYFAMDAADKSLELEDQFIIMYVHSALSADSSASTRALQHSVNSPAQVTGHFSGISYSKGASFLLMLKHFLTEDTFKKALHKFLVEKSYEHAIPEDLYVAFEEAVAEDASLSQIEDDVNMTDFMSYWVNEQGYPLIHVNVNTDTGVMSITQERFFISSSTSQTDQIWPLPLTYTTGNNPNWSDTRAKHVMTDKTYEITKEPGHEWVIFNVKQTGIYRVNYDTHNWEMISAALKENKDNIHHLNRAQIVDDIFALMRSEKLTFQLGFELLDFLKQDTSYYVWYPAITGFSWLRNRFLHLPAVLNEFDKIIIEFIDTAVNELGYEVIPGEPLTTTLNRFYLLTFACNVGHEGCINNALEQFRSFTETGVPINPNVRRHVICAGLREGSYEDWKVVQQYYLNSNNQAAKVAYLRSLGCTTNEQAIQEYLEMVLSDDVKAQDSLNAFTFLYMGDRANARLALPFIKEHVDDIRKKVVLSTWFNSVFSNLAGYMDVEGLNEMEQWLNDSQDTIPEYTVGLNAITSARSSMQWGTNNGQAIINAVRGSAVAAVPSAVLLIVSLATLILNKS